jgi:hypothetical protein
MAGSPRLYSELGSHCKRKLGSQDSAFPGLLHSKLDIIPYGTHTHDKLQTIYNIPRLVTM